MAAYTLFKKGSLSTIALILSITVSCAVVINPTPAFALTCASNANGTGDNPAFGASAVSQIGWATKFTATNSCTVTSMGATYYVAAGSPSNVRIQIFTDGGNNPGTLIGTCGGAPSPTPSATKQEYTQGSCDTINLISGTSYWLALNVSVDNSSGNYYRVWGHWPAAFSCSSQSSVDGAWSGGPSCGQDDIQFTITGTAYTPPAAPAPLPIFWRAFMW